MFTARYGLGLLSFRLGFFKGLNVRRGQTGVQRHKEQTTVHSNCVTIHMTLQALTDAFIFLTWRTTFLKSDVLGSSAYWSFGTITTVSLNHSTIIPCNWYRKKRLKPWKKVVSNWETGHCLDNSHYYLDQTSRNCETNISHRHITLYTQRPITNRDNWKK